MLVPVKELVDWMVREWPEIEKSRADYDAKSEAGNEAKNGRAAA
jgi:hypothetical protein